MDFTINYMSRVSAVLKEALLLKKYKAMHPGFAIPVGILMIPMAIASIICALFLYVMGYLFSISSLPVQSLHKLVKDEGKSVQHGTQVVVYLLSWGFVFTSYVALSFFMVWLTVLYSLFSIFTYTWSLGGIKFHLFSKEEDISVEVGGRYNFLIPVIFIAVMGVLVIVFPLIGAISSAVRYGSNYVTFSLFVRFFINRMMGTGFIRFLFSIAYTAIVFAPRPRKIEE